MGRLLEPAMLCTRKELDCFLCPGLVIHISSSQHQPVFAAHRWTTTEAPPVGQPDERRDGPLAASSFAWLCSDLRPSCATSCAASCAASLQRAMQLAAKPAAQASNGTKPAMQAYLQPAVQQLWGGFPAHALFTTRFCFQNCSFLGENDSPNFAPLLFNSMFYTSTTTEKKEKKVHIGSVLFSFLRGSLRTSS